MRAPACCSRPTIREDLVGVARARVEAGPVDDRLADRDVAVHAGLCSTMPDPLAQLARALPGSWPSTETMPRVRSR